MSKTQAPVASSGGHTILGHPDALFVLFFTEMWERFSYYGMRALLVLFLISTQTQGGWAWTREEAGSLYGWYTMVVYATPILGGYLADRVLGLRRSVVIGGLIIAAGHISLFMDTVPSFYLGLGLVCAGTGLFKPNISAIVGQLYGKGNENARDAGYTLFYMGVNAGAFFGISLCGYIGEKISWNYGFGLAAVFMLLGALQFWLGQGIFGSIGGQPSKGSETAAPAQAREADEASSHVVADRLKVIAVLSFFTIFFWFAFEQAGGSMTIFAADYTDRALVGTGGFVFKIVNSLITLIPAAILTALLVQLWRGAGKRFPVSNLLLTLAMVLIWVASLGMLGREFGMDQSEVPATWFGVLNSFFLVILAPMFSRMWTKYWNPTAPIKFATGLILLGLGFGALSFGAMGIAPGAQTAKVSMFYLTLAYLLHTMGELCLSPVGLSYISKLAPSRFLGLMFGLWYLNTSIGNKLAGMMSSYIDHISEVYGMAGFFLIIGLIPIGAGVLAMLLNKWMVKRMHGIH